MSVTNLSLTDGYTDDFPALELAIFHLQDVCVRVQKGMRRRLRTAGLEKAPEIEATFRWLRKRGIRIYLLSDYGREETSILLERLGWLVGEGELIECAIVNVLSNDHPIQRALELANNPDPTKTIVVVDTPKLLESAWRSNIYFNLGVTSGSCSYHALHGKSSRALLDNTVQLVNYLLGQMPGLAEQGLRN